MQHLSGSNPKKTHQFKREREKVHSLLLRLDEQRRIFSWPFYHSMWCFVM